MKQRINSVSSSFYHNKLKQCMITRDGKSPRTNQFFFSPTVSRRPLAVAATSSHTQAAWAMPVAAAAAAVTGTAPQVTPPSTAGKKAVEATSSRIWAS